MFSAAFWSNDWFQVKTEYAVVSGDTVLVYWDGAFDNPGGCTTLKLFCPETTPWLAGVVVVSTFVAGYNPQGCRGCHLDCQAILVRTTPSDTTLEGLDCYQCVIKSWLVIARWLVCHLKEVHLPSNHGIVKLAIKDAWSVKSLVKITRTRCNEACAPN